MGTTPSGKVQIISQGDLLPPGNCALCGGSYSEKGFLDFQLYIDLWGQFYICIDNCAGEIIRSVDGAMPSDVLILESQIDEARNIIQRLEAENGKLKDDIDAVRRFISINTDNPSDLYVPSDLGDEKGTPEQGVLIDESLTVGTEPDSEPSEPIKVPGRKTVTLVESSDPTGLNV